MVCYMDNHVDIQIKTLHAISSDPWYRQDREGRLLDVRGEVDSFWYTKHSHGYFMRLFGHEISLMDLKKENCKMRLTRKHSRSNLYLRYWHPTMKMVFTFKTRDFKEANNFMGLQLQQVVREMTDAAHFINCYGDHHRSNVDCITLSKNEFNKLKQDQETLITTRESLASQHSETAYIEVPSIEALTTMQLLEEVERRYKLQNPDWAYDILNPKKPNSADIIRICA